MPIQRDVGAHPRLPEFQAGKFYAVDFIKLAFRFITVYNPDGETILEFAHVDPKCNRIGYSYTWVTPDDEIVSAKDVIELLVMGCEVYGEIYFDVFINDTFKPNPLLSSKRVFRYHMELSGETKHTRGWESHRGLVEKLYNVEAVDDVKSFYSVTQIGIK